MQVPTNSAAAANKTMPALKPETQRLSMKLLHYLPVQPKLSIGAVNNPLEHEADAMTDKVMSMQEVPAVEASASNGIQRKCVDCEEEEKVQRKPLASFIQRKESSAGTVASDAVSNKINASKGKGNHMDSNTQTFMQNRFGAGFSDVKIHTGGEAIQMNRELSAKAFTVGNDIYFNEGQYNPNSENGKHLLAHELTHTVQQGGATGISLQRRLQVQRPRKRRNRTTNAAIVQGYLGQLCTAANPIVNTSTGLVSLDPDFCTPVPEVPGSGAAPGLSPAQSSATPVGCGCLCDITASANLWTIKVDDRAWPHTNFDDEDGADGITAGGTGGMVTIPSPFSARQYGAVTGGGGFDIIPPWLILGHELCGHAWLGNTGAHASDHSAIRGRGGHQTTVGRENLLRDEHSIDRRGTFRKPHCGESFSISGSAVPAAGTVTFSRYYAECKNWRVEYNKLNSTNYSEADTIPVVPGEILPP